MFQRWQESRWRRARIAELNRIIAAAYASTRGLDNQTAKILVKNRTEWEQNELNHLLQANLLRQARNRNLSIPDENFEPLDHLLKHSVLTDEGEEWVRQEIHRLRRDDVEFWTKFIPILLVTVLIAILIRSCR